jgi:hypothetical protein
MRILWFIYFSIASLAIKRNVFGRWQGSCTSLFCCTYILIFGIAIYFQRLINFKPENALLWASILYGGGGVILFILLRCLFLKPKKILFYKEKFKTVPKWLFRIIGISYLLGCIIMGTMLGIMSNSMI